MTSPLWDKGNTDVDRRLMEFTAGEDVILDRQLFIYDIAASIAHVRGLGTITVLSQDEVTRLVESLTSLREAFSSGSFQLDERFEDGHSAIEFYLTQALGELGKKVHTGRSRNDQVLVAQRLFLRDALHRLARNCAAIADVALHRARQERDIPMPGYTHLQRAVPSSLGMWFAAFAEAFIDNGNLARSTASWLNSNPLGTAAGYGVNLPLPRDQVSAELAFERLQVNPIYAQNSRGKFEFQALTALLQALLDTRRLAWDLSLFTTEEFAFVELPDAYTTGSSIMPNKRNPDVVELLRAATSPAVGAINELISLLSLPSGYHRDLQNTKGPVLRALNRGLTAIELIAPLLDALRFSPDALRNAISGPMHATDHAVDLTGQGVPFRDAYRQVAASLDQFANRKPEDSLQARISPGGCANLLLEQLQSRLQQLTQAL
ncbi:argininosuccinate lyase [Lujinxingia litoralis]|uniref:Argininosuccinate lyase n=1 Tax=Lujinxingia litoralis TaxID=2211119 RepID=A0A328C9P2_9DELT|nr:argininosuccinate lyase [Lujinxingia litoralis]RAL22885.1 argininosuccinate lyase [Lujinxingia litoralis]